MTNEEQRIAIAPDVYARFWSKVAVTDEGRCWNWQGAKDDCGYGNFILSGKCESSQRVAFLLWNGYWPEHGLHKCDNPACCNPAHIYSGNHQDNMRDMVVRGRLGENHGRAVLDNASVLKIRQLYKTGTISQPQLARQFGCSQVTVQRIVNRKTWRHI